MNKIARVNGYSMRASRIIFDMEIFHDMYFDRFGSSKGYLRFTSDPPGAFPAVFKSWLEVKEWMRGVSE